MAKAGDEVVVTNGVYPGCVAVTNPLMLLSVNGPQFTIIDGGGTNRCVSLANGVTFARVHSTYGAALTGGGVWCASTNVFLTNCVIQGKPAGSSADGSGGGAFGGTSTTAR